MTRRNNNRNNAKREVNNNSYATIEAEDKYKSIAEMLFSGLICIAIIATPLINLYQATLLKSFVDYSKDCSAYTTVQGLVNGQPSTVMVNICKLNEMQKQQQQPVSQKYRMNKQEKSMEA